MRVAAAHKKAFRQRDEVGVWLGLLARLCNDGAGKRIFQSDSSRPREHELLGSTIGFAEWMGGFVSISAQIWKQIGSGANVSGRKPPVPAAALARLGNLSEAPAFSLMHQLFFPNATLRRTSILFAAADAHSKASAFL